MPEQYSELHHSVDYLNVSSWNTSAGVAQPNTFRGLLFIS
jgi:hypothetical protein